jgi:hypothetical protein
VPAAFLIGLSDAEVVDGVLGRLALLVARIGARTAVVDASGLVEPLGRDVLDGLRRFAAHDSVAGRCTIVAVGLNAVERREWRAVAGNAGATLEFAEDLGEALAAARGAAG